MRAIRFLPVVFLVGIDGFAMFAPYVVALFLTGYVISRLRKSRTPAMTAAAVVIEDDVASAALTA